MARIQNSMVTGAGAGGVGDRGFGHYIPTSTGNPYDSNNFIYRWRQYCRLYEMSWEARKIIRIPVEDALRKDWLIEDLPEDVIKKLKFKQEQVGFENILSRSCMLERLLGGCLSFFGLVSQEDNTEKTYHASREKSELKFMNAIPVSRISRVTWDTNPLSEHYMRPSSYLVNGQEVHVSRCLVWDGEPLFDPYDYALNNFRSNLSGFGPSKLAPIWDDIVKAVGTRQAAYQLIQMNNAIIAAVNDLSDLQGTKSGQKALQMVKDVANQLSLYKAAIIDGGNGNGDGVKINQHSASFGSVPELLMTFIQVLSAASDIPATRFLGQAPGGLNATGESDLENYYNVIDAFQHKRLEPGIRRFYDVIGYNMFPNWNKLREKMSIKFPPLWNLSELEEADLHTKQLDNVMKAFDAGFIGEPKVLEEINAKNVFSVNLDETDITLVDVGEPGLSGNGDQNVDPEEELKRLQGRKTAIQGFLGQGEAKGKVGQENPIQIDLEDKNRSFYVNSWPLLIAKAGGLPPGVDLTKFRKGFAVEQEHAATVGGDEVTIAKIAMDHLKEDPNYYSKLEKIENINLPRLPNPTDPQKHAGNYKKHHIKIHGLNISIENPSGSAREGIDADGNKWSSILPAHYGYVKQTEGADGDHVDVFVGPNEKSDQVYIVDQYDVNTKKFDEHKVILGCTAPQQAHQLYLDAFSDGKGLERIGRFTPTTIEVFKDWLKNGNTKKQFANGPVKKQRTRK